VKKEDVIGKVVAVIPYMGYLGYFVRTPIGFAILIIMPAIILIILEIREIIKKPKLEGGSVFAKPHPQQI